MSSIRMQTRQTPVRTIEPWVPAGRSTVAAGQAGTGGADEGEASRVSHVGLMVLAREVQAATASDDLVALRAAVHRLSRRLRQHVEGERAGHDHLAPALRAVVFGGQDRLLRLVDGMSGGDCHGVCLTRGAELVAALRRQASLEVAVRLHPANGD
jgi:hypothetical protein